MAVVQGKSISELGTPLTVMKNDDLAVISDKQSNGTFLSKAVKKEAFEKFTMASGNRDDATRDSNVHKDVYFRDNSGNGSGFIEQSYYTDGSNTLKLISRKVVSGSNVDAVVGLMVPASGSGNRVIYCTTDSMGVGPNPTSNSGNILITGSSAAVDLRPQSGTNAGGHIDFHYNGSTSDYTSRIIEDSSKMQMISNDKNVEIKANASGKQVILNAATNNAVLQNSPTQPDNNKTSKAIATVGWVASNFLPQSSFIDPSSDMGDLSDQLELLKGLLNKKNLIIYVDSSSGNTFGSDSSYVVKDIPGTSGYRGIYETKDSSGMRAVKSLYDAVAIAKKMKFLEDSSCIIRLLSDTGFNYNAAGRLQSLYFNHPDLVQGKKFYIQGWAAPAGKYNSSTFTCNDHTGSYRNRKISANLKNASTILGNMFATMIGSSCSTEFTYIEFNGGLDKSCYWNGSSFSLKSEYAYDSYFLRNTGSDSIVITNCVFSGCDHAVVGAGISVSNTAFTLCKFCLLTLSGSRCNVFGSININYCVNGIRAGWGGMIHITVNNSNPKFRLMVSGLPFSVTDSGQIILALYTALNDMAVVPDNNGSIIIDGAKYSRATSSTQSGIKVNINMAGLCIQKITGLNVYNEATVDDITVEDATASGIKSFQKKMIGIEENGYTSSGYVNITYGSYLWTKLYSESGYTSGINSWGQKTIPGITWND